MTMLNGTTLPPDLVALQERWLAVGNETRGREAQDALYAREFAPRFAPHFATLPLVGAPPSMPRPKALVSVLGFSWQPVALMAAWCKPQRMLVLGTSESLGLKVDGEGVVSLIARVAGISRDDIEPITVGEAGEADIYRAVRDFLRRCGVPTRQVFLEMTGGKKSMSASAALAGFLEGSPLVYVDYGQYHGPHRIPVAGSEYPRLLTNPLEVMGDLDLRDIFGAFNRSDFAEAERLAQRLAARMYEPREAECLAFLARGYAAWDRFEFDEARKALNEARSRLTSFASQGRWSWAGSVNGRLEVNLGVLEALSAAMTAHPESVEAALPLLLWYLASARRLLQVEKRSLAVLLTYAAVERYIDLCLWVEFGLDDEDPDYTLIADHLDLARYHELGKKLFKKYRPEEPSGPIMMTRGAQLLAALSEKRMPIEVLFALRGLSAARNKCEYEHGLRPQTPSEDDVSKFLQTAGGLISGLCGGSDLEAALQAYAFPSLGPV